MTELAPLAAFQDSEPVLEIRQLFAASVNLSLNGAVPIFSGEGEGFWRIRSLNVAGRFTGTSGTNTLSLAIFSGFPHPGPSTGLQFTSAVPTAFDFDDGFSVTWSTEVGTSYGGQKEVNWGESWNVSLPLLWFDQYAVVELDNSALPFADADAFLEDGSMQIEYLAPGGAVRGGSGGPLYLLAGGG